MYVCTLCVCVCVCVCVRARARIYVCMYVRVCITYVCKHVSGCARACVCVCTNLCVCVCMYMRECMCAHMCVRMYYLYILFFVSVINILKRTIRLVTQHVNK